MKVVAEHFIALAKNECFAGSRWFKGGSVVVLADKPLNVVTHVAVESKGLIFLLVDTLRVTPIAFYFINHTHIQYLNDAEEHSYAQMYGDLHFDLSRKVGDKTICHVLKDQLTSKSFSQVLVFDC